MQGNTHSDFLPGLQQYNPWGCVAEGEGKGQNSVWMKQGVSRKTGRAVSVNVIFYLHENKSMMHTNGAIEL